MNPRNVGELTAWLRERISRFLERKPDEVPTTQPFVDMGLSSVDGVGLLGELEEVLGHELPISTLYDHSDINRLARHLSRSASSEETLAPDQLVSGERLVIVGMACRFPGARTLDEYWELLSEGRDAIGPMSERRRAHLPRSGSRRLAGYLDDLGHFDAGFFSISPREASRMDPQHRLLLETSWEALEDAGVPVTPGEERRAGVFVGISSNDYFQIVLSEPEPDVHLPTGNSGAIAANRLSYTFNFTGPSVAVDSACSSSLSALHLALSSLKQGECNMALVAGVNALLSEPLMAAFERAGFLAPDGRCKTFDESANGYVRAEGVGVLVIKRLQDALSGGDRIYALLEGSAINNDGKSNGLTAPSARAQVDAIRRACTSARITPSQLSYIELHGTGTSLGDPIEAQALGESRSGAEQKVPCRIGSVKTNIGHLEAAAGVASVIKLALCLKHETLVPSLHCNQVNSLIDLQGLGLELQTKTERWPSSGRRFAGASGFGFGGTNVHVVLGEAPQRLEAEHPSKRDKWFLPISAKMPDSLAEYSRRLADFVTRERPRLADLEYTLGWRRTHHRHRAAFVVSSTDELIEALQNYKNGVSEKSWQDVEDCEELDDALVRAKRFMEKLELGSPPPGGCHVSAPTYAWQRDYCWSQGLGESPQQGVLDIATATSSKLWQISVPPGEAALTDHRIAGEPVASVSLMLRWIRAAVAEALDLDIHAFDEVLLERRLAISPVRNSQVGPLRIQVTLQDEGRGEFSFELHGRPAGATSWSKHMHGVVRTAPPPSGSKTLSTAS